MNKNELVSAVAEQAGLEKGKAQSAVDAVFAVITRIEEWAGTSGMVDRQFLRFEA